MIRSKTYNNNKAIIKHLVDEVLHFDFIVVVFVELLLLYIFKVGIKRELLFVIKINKEKNIQKQNCEKKYV